MPRLRAIGATLLAAAVLAIGVGAKSLRNGGDEAFRVITGAGHVADDLSFPKPKLPGGAAGDLGNIGRQNAHPGVRETARDVLCDQLSNLVGPESEGKITFDELLDSVTTIVSKRLVNVDVFVVEHVTDQLMTSANIAQKVNPSAAQGYMRACPPSL
jgi:hypothetical protein